MPSENDGVMIVLSSPSGAGKTTLVKMLSKMDNYEISISHTTRQPRPNEINNEDYYFDIAAKYKGKKHYFEVEVKNQWSESWPSSWTELRIPGRKKRLVQKHKDLHTDTTLTFIVLNTDLTKAWVVHSDVLESSPIGTIQNSSRVGSPHLKEPFFHVPISDARGIFLK